jgi:hypothetical protein
VEWLKIEYDVDSTLHIKKSMYLSGETMPETKVSTLLKKLKKGTKHVQYQQTITRNSQFKMNVLMKWDKTCDKALVVATTIATPMEADGKVCKTI